MTRPSRWIDLFFRIRTQLLLLALASLFFLLVYELLLVNHVAGIVVTRKIAVDRIFYRDVFANLPTAVLALAGIFFLVVICFRHLRAALLWFEGREKLLLFCCAILLISVQAITIVTVRSIPTDDSLEYIKLANTLFHQHSYISDGGFPTSYWPVGYPLYLTLLKFLFGDMTLAARVMNVVIALGLVATLLAVFKPWLNQREQLIFILVTALLPNLLLSSNVILSDYLFTLLLWIAVWIYLRCKHSVTSFAAIGLVLAVMSYLRPIALLLPLVFFASVWREGELKTHRTVIFMALFTFFAMITPWAVRNYGVFRAVVPISTNGGYNFLMGNHEGAAGGVNNDFPYDAANPNEAEESANAFKAGVRAILNDPLQSILRLPKKVFELYRRGDSSLSWAIKRTENPLNPLLLSFLFFATNASSYFVIYISVLTIVGCYFFKNPMTIHPLLVMIYCYGILVTLVFVGSERYLIPTFPIHQFLFAKFLSSSIKA